MEALKEQIGLLTLEESELLKADKLPKKRWNATGLYLVCEPEHYVALDYSERQSWRGYFGNDKNAPSGHIKDFSNPLDAIDWLLSL